MTDQTLIAEIKKGNNKAFEQLFRKYFRILSIYAFKYVKDLDVAQDLTQEVFVKIFEKRRSLEIHTAIKSFLYTAVRNRCLDHIKINRIRSDHQAIIKSEQSGTEIDQSDVVLQLELQEKIHQIISELPEQSQRVFKLSRLEGKSNQEIADLCKISKRTVETHISNALKKLRERLSHYINLLIIIYIQIFL